MRITRTVNLTVLLFEKRESSLAKTSEKYYSVLLVYWILCSAKRFKCLLKNRVLLKLNEKSYALSCIML